MIIQEHATKFPFAVRCLDSLPERNFDRYENPFERKWTLRDKVNIPEVIEGVFRYLERHIKLAEETVGFNLVQDQHRHYHGIFKYMPGDELKVHVDAGIHPMSGLRKQFTALLYLNDSGGDLEFWNGSTCIADYPHVIVLKEKVSPRSGTFVLFENTDYAWHGVTVNESDVPRYVATVSFMSDKIDMFENKKQRAYFVPRPTEKWPHEISELRDKRVDPEKFSEVYRTS